jgi:protein-S-isoprenylcysteine O-methyltransferase Ste14
MATVEALNSNDITKVGVVVIVALVVIGLLLSFVITALIARVIIIVLVVGLSVLVWQQRTHIKDKFDKCDTRATFFGVHVDAPQSIKDKCRRLHG